MERVFYREVQRAHYIAFFVILPILTTLTVALQAFILYDAMPAARHIMLPFILIAFIIIMTVTLISFYIALRRRHRTRLCISGDSLKVAFDRRKGEQTILQVELKDIYGILITKKRKGRISELALYHNDGKNIDYIGDFKDMEGMLAILKELLTNGGRVVERNKAFNRKLKAVAICFYILCFALFIALALNLPREGIWSYFSVIPILLVLVSFYVEEKLKNRKIRTDMERAGERWLQSRGVAND